MRDDLGAIPGTLPMSKIGLKGGARTPTPSIVVNFRSETTGCDQPLFCAVTVTDGTLRQGQGHHGSFSRADTANFMAAIGPAFKSGFRNRGAGEQCRHRADTGADDRREAAAGRQAAGPPITEALVGGKPVSRGATISSRRRATVGCAPS